MLEEVVREKRLWLYTNLAEKKALTPEVPRQEYGASEVYRDLGRSYRLLVVCNQDVPLKLNAGRFRPRHDARKRDRETDGPRKGQSIFPRPAADRERDSLFFRGLPRARLHRGGHRAPLLRSHRTEVLVAWDRPPEVVESVLPPYGHVKTTPRNHGQPIRSLQPAFRVRRRTRSPTAGLPPSSRSGEHRFAWQLAASAS